MTTAYGAVPNLADGGAHRICSTHGVLHVDGPSVLVVTIALSFSEAVFFLYEEETGESILRRDGSELQNSVLTKFLILLKTKIRQGFVGPKTAVTQAEIVCLYIAGLASTRKSGGKNRMYRK